MSGLLLEIVEGPDAGERLALDDAVELGRDPGLARPLDDAKVSRRHARITPIGGGAQLEDLGSTNGTFLNESPLEIVTALKPGDRIRVGLTVLELRRTDDRAPLPAAPDITDIGADVLEPVPESDLVAVSDPSPAPAAVRAQSSEPRYVNTRIGRRIDELIAEDPTPGTDEHGAPSPLEPPAAAPAPPPPPPARGSAGDPENYEAIAHLIDSRVKSRTNVAAFALLAIAALAVIIYFGAT